MAARGGGHGDARLRLWESFPPHRPPPQAERSLNLPTHPEDVVVSHGIQANSPAMWSSHASFDDDRAPIDHRVEVADPRVFHNYKAYREIIQGMLADGPVLGKYDLTLGTGQLGDLAPQPIGFTMVIGRRIESHGGVIQCHDLDILLPSLWVCLVYSEP